MPTDSKLSVRGRVDTRIYQESPPSDLSDSEKLTWLREKNPVEQFTEYNTTVFGMHEYFAINLSEDASINEYASHLAIGDDGTDPEVTNDTLNNEVFRKEVTDTSQVDNELLCSTFVDSEEANGETFREVGLFAGTDPSDRMWNHSTISSIDKDNTRTITIDITLTFEAA